MFRDPIGHRIKMLSNLMKRNMDRHFGPQHDRATMMQAWIIGYVMLRDQQGKDTFQKDIEEEFSINRSTTSEMLKLMDKKGMVKRVPVDYDARLKKIVLTSKSLEFHDWVSSTVSRLHEELVDRMSDEEIETTIYLLDKLIDNIKKSVK